MNDRNSFFSMDRLVEFGMGMAMSQQIANSMNDMMARMRTPPQMQVAAQPLYAMQTMQQGTPAQPMFRQPAEQVASPSPAATANAAAQAVAGAAQASPQTPPPLTALPEVYYAALDGAQCGPYSGTEIARLVLEKKVTATTLVWKGGMQEWKPAEEFPELLCLISLVPPALRQEESKTGGSE